MKKHCTTYKFKDPLGPANKATQVWFAVMTNTSIKAEVIQLYIGKKFAEDEAVKLSGCVRMGVVYQGEFLEIN